MDKSQRPALVGASYSSPSRIELIALVFILIVGAICRFEHIAQAGLWMDEIWSIEISTGRGSAHTHLPANVIQNSQQELTSLSSAGPWWRVWTGAVDAPGHPPLYNLVQRFWMDLFGVSPAAVRSLAAMESLLAIVVLFDVCRLLHGNRAALLASAIMAIALPQLDFAQDACAYAQLTLVALCAADALIRIERLGPNPRRLIALACFAGASALTHYFSAGFLLGLFVYAMLRLGRPARRKTVVALVAAGLLAIVLWGPWMIVQFQQLPKTYPAFLLEPSTHHRQYTFRRIIGLPAQYLVGHDYAAQLPSLDLVVIAIFVLIVPWLRLRWRPDLLFWCIWIAGTLGFITIYDLVHPAIQLAYLRYTILASPGIYAILGSFDWPRQKLPGQIVPATTIILLAALATSRLQSGSQTREDWRQLSTVLDSSAAPDDLVIFYGDDPWIPPGVSYMAFEYYAPDSHRPWLILQRRPSPDLLTELRRHQSIWLVGVNPTHDGPRLLPGWRPVADMSTTAGAICHLVHPAEAVSTR